MVDDVTKARATCELVATFDYYSRQEIQVALHCGGRENLTGVVVGGEPEVEQQTNASRADVADFRIETATTGVWRRVALHPKSAVVDVHQLQPRPTDAAASTADLSGIWGASPERPGDRCESPWATGIDALTVCPLFLWTLISFAMISHVLVEITRACCHRTCLLRSHVLSDIACAC
jgi:hypothetical protein